MRQAMIWFLVLPLLAVAAVKAPPPSKKVKLLNTGSFHYEEAYLSDTLLTWFGIFKTSSGFELKKVKLSVRKVKDRLGLDEPDKRTGREVSINIRKEPIILIGGIDSLKERPIAGRMGSHQILKPGKPEKHFLNGSNYYLKAAGNMYVVQNGDTGFTHYIIVLENKTTHQKQALCANLEFEGEGPTPYWTGDIDGDGKLDVIYDLTTNYNMSVLTLYLSSAAEPGKLVKKVAEWTTVGC